MSTSRLIDRSPVCQSNREGASVGGSALNDYLGTRRRSVSAQGPLRTLTERVTVERIKSGVPSQRQSPSLVCGGYSKSSTANATSVNGSTATSRHHQELVISAHYQREPEIWLHPEQVSKAESSGRRTEPAAASKSPAIEPRHNSASLRAPSGVGGGVVGASHQSTIPHRATAATTTTDCTSSDFSGCSTAVNTKTDRSEAISSEFYSTAYRSSLPLASSRNPLPPLKAAKTISQIRRRSSPPPLKPPPSPTTWSSLVPHSSLSATVSPESPPPDSALSYSDLGTGGGSVPSSTQINGSQPFDSSRVGAVGQIFRQFATMLLTNNKVDVLDGSTVTGGMADDTDSGVVVGGMGVGSDGSLAGGGGRSNSGGTMRKAYSASNPTRLENTHLDTTASGHSMLDSNRVRIMSPYLSYSTVMSHAIQEFFEGKVRGKLEPDHIFYDNMLLYFAYFFAFRNILLAFIEDIQWRGWLGETERARPQRQLVMVFSIWSVFIALSLKNFSRAMNSKYRLSWLSPFLVLRGEQTPQSYGMSQDMLYDWYEWTMSCWRRYFLFSAGTIASVLIFFIGIVRHRWNSYPTEDGKMWFNVMTIIWAVINVLWTYLAATHSYICFVYFNSLCYYFRLRYEKVNRDIEIIISQRLKANERVAMLHHILIEHNELCLKVSEYNKFWAKYLMATYFFLIAVICFTMFQAFFTTNYIFVRLVMFMYACTCAYIITRISVSAAVMSNTAHHPYGRLIRVSFEKYPVELQIQLRMFIQRTSGPTIGFYCLDVFEITYTTYASILAALGQNFLLIVDFVRSYAEVGKEYDDISLSQFNLLTESVFNSTLDVIDEMTGAHLSEQFTNHTLLTMMHT